MWVRLLLSARYMSLIPGQVRLQICVPSERSDRYRVRKIDLYHVLHTDRGTRVKHNSNANVFTKVMRIYLNNCLINLTQTYFFNQISPQITDL